MDHVGGLERLLPPALTDESWRGRVRLYAHAVLVPLLQARIADYPEVLAEGGANFWDAFALVPLSKSGFWHDGMRFNVCDASSCAELPFGLSLGVGVSCLTGDTRPVPKCRPGAAHTGKWSRTTAPRLVGKPVAYRRRRSEREYPQELRTRLVLYHHASLADAGTYAGADTASRIATKRRVGVAAARGQPVSRLTWASILLRLDGSLPRSAGVGA